MEEIRCPPQTLFGASLDSIYINLHFGVPNNPKNVGNHSAFQKVWKIIMDRRLNTLKQKNNRIIISRKGRNSMLMQLALPLLPLLCRLKGRKEEWEPPPRLQVQVLQEGGWERTGAAAPPLHHFRHSRELSKNPLFCHQNSMAVRWGGRTRSYCCSLPLPLWERHN